MGLMINTNPTSINAQKNLSNTQRSLAANISRLSSGNRINTAADDAAGMGISEKMKAQIRSLGQAQRNANDGVSMVQVAEGAMNEQAGILTRLRELATQSSNGTLSDTERGFINTEATQLVSELDRIATSTDFNGTKMLATTGGTTVDLQVGANGGDTLSVFFSGTDSAELGVDAVDLSTQGGASSALATIDAAIETLSTARSGVGAAQNRLVVTVNNLSSITESLSAANSRIRDVDVAEETASLTKNQVLSQAGLAVLSQANQLPSAALSLLRG